MHGLLFAQRPLQHCFLCRHIDPSILISSTKGCKPKTWNRLAFEFRFQHFCTNFCSYKTYHSKTNLSCLKPCKYNANTTILCRIFFLIKFFIALKKITHCEHCTLVSSDAWTFTPQNKSLTQQEEDMLWKTLVFFCKFNSLAGKFSCPWLRRFIVDGRTSENEYVCIMKIAHAPLHAASTRGASYK